MVEELYEEEKGHIMKTIYKIIRKTFLRKTNLFLMSWK
jgi:hypothetical protein